jgi:hypothetical protein
LSNHPILFLLIVAFFVAIITAIAVHALHRARKSTRASWEDLLQRLVPLDHGRVEKIALDIIDSSGLPRQDQDSAALSASQIWELIGGWKGLEALENNCSVLIDLAFYVQQWYPEALAVTENLRLSAREISWNISRLKVAHQSGKLETIIPMYGQRAIATYYLMTRNVLALYQQGNLAMLADLQRVL